MKHPVIVMIALSLQASSPMISHADTTWAQGIVYSDLNANKTRELNEPGLPDVRVSNGRVITTTDKDGTYQLPIRDGDIIFVIKPSQWKPPVDAQNRPKFFYTYKPSGSPKLKYAGNKPTGPLPTSIDFPLTPVSEPSQFDAIILGDTQVRNAKEVGYLSRDIVAELIGTKAAFTAILGDIVFDDLSVYKDIIPVMGQIGNPQYYVKGNHDTNYDGYEHSKYINETFERHFGPSYYSYDVGKVHFLVIDNPAFSTVDFRTYTGSIGIQQMYFIKSDLTFLPKDQLVVMLSHIPFSEMEADNRKKLFALLADHPNLLAMSAHWHNQYFSQMGKSVGWDQPQPLLNVVLGTSCGNWWGGAVDETGIPNAMMSDGTPNGYATVHFNGNRFSIRYKAARKPTDYQMQIAAPDVVSAADAGSTDVLVNFFVGSEGAKIEMQIAGFPVLPMSRTEKGWTPKGEVAATAYALWNGSKNPHLWQCSLPSGMKRGSTTMHFTATDYFGQQHKASQVIVVK